MDNYTAILKQYWGFDSFRGIQASIIQSIGEGKDTLGLMPTGGGKSITFQVPALAQSGLCLVVTPLIALMKDQVANLRKKGIKAVAVYAGMTREQIGIAYDNCLYGDYKFLYISPERLGTELFKQKVRFMKINLIAVDEAHCISQWGYDFRPSYLKIAEIRTLLPDVPVLALTATATLEVVKDIQEKLAFRHENAYRMSFERRNIAYVVRNTEDKVGEVIHILQRIQGTAIVYTRNREQTAEIARMLEQVGETATFFHAGLSNAEKDRRQHAWTMNELRVMVATNAFGMGIDKPDVRIVIHLDFPDSVEAYFQEAGRAGRDGKKAFAVLLHAKSDRKILRKRIDDTFPPKDYIRKVYDDIQYFLQVAMGDGRGSVHPFELDKFCKNFKHFPIRVESALKILTRAGYLEWTDEQETLSRVRFLMTKESLYHLKRYDEQTEKLMEGILRFYTGVFTDFAYIDEDKLAQFAQMSREGVYQQLLWLSRTGVVKYVPGARMAFIIYTCERRDSNRLIIGKDVYEDRKQHLEKSINSILNYAAEENCCRSRLLLAYFGEKDVPNCGHCDVCLQQHRSGLKRARFEFIEKEMLHRIQEKPMVAADLLRSLEFDVTDMEKTLSFLIAEQMVEQRDGFLYVVSAYNKTLYE